MQIRFPRLFVSWITVSFCHGEQYKRIIKCVGLTSHFIHFPSSLLQQQQIVSSSLYLLLSLPALASPHPLRGSVINLNLFFLCNGSFSYASFTYLLCYTLLRLSKYPTITFVVWAPARLWYFHKDLHQLSRDSPKKFNSSPIGSLLQSPMIWQHHLFSFVFSALEVVAATHHY